MSISFKSVALTSGRHLSDTRCYLKASRGDVYEATLDFTEDFLESVTQRGFAKRVVEWSSAGFILQCDENSSLCPITWDSSTRSIFYQDRNRTLREWRLIDGHNWEQTTFEQPNVKIGTNIAVVSIAGRKNVTLLFYQDWAGYICYRAAESGSWCDPDDAAAAVRLAKALPLTGIGACLNRNRDVRVYYQDESFAIREYCGSYGGKWFISEDMVSKRDIIINDIATITPVIDGLPEIRLYMQDARGVIIECTRSHAGWKVDQLTKNAVTSANIIAIASLSPNFRISILWISEDHNMYICDCDNQDSWSEPRALILFKHQDSRRRTTSDGSTPFDKPVHPTIVVPQSRPGSAASKPPAVGNGQHPNAGFPAKKPPPPPSSRKPSGSVLSPSVNHFPLPGIGTMPDVLSPLPGKLLLTPGSGTIRGDPELLDSYFPIRSSRVESDAEGHGVRSPLRRPITPSPVSPLSHDPRAAGDRPSKVIKKVYVRIERHVYDVKIAYDGGSETSWRSSNTGQQLEFELAEGEYITHVWYAADNDSIQGVLFGTSTGRKSGWLGFEYGLYGLLVKDGCILGSLSGIIQDGRLSTLTPEWLPYRLGGEIRWYQTRHATLEAEWTEYRSAVAELEQQISGGRISWDQLGTYTIAVTDALAELVQDVEILRGMEQESSTALVKVTALREEYLTSHLRVCRQASEAIRTQLSLLANVLGPLSGQLGPSVESIRERGAKLLSLLVKLREDVQVYIQSLGQVVVNLGNELDIWKLQADSARLAFAEDKEKFNKVMAPKGITVTETNDQEASLWGLQDWYHRIPPELIENTAESHILVEVTKSDARMQYAISQITFLQRNKKQLSAHKSQVETLQRQIDVTVSSLRDVIRTVQSLHPDGGAISQGGSNLAALVKSLVALVEQLLVATRSREFGTILVSILQSILSDTGFEFREDGRLLLRASKAIIS